MSDDTTTGCPSNPHAPRCQAKSRRSGKQCGMPARRGFKVCWMHGAGSGKRESDGEKKPASERNLKHGLYARRPRPWGDDAVREYVETGDALYSLDTVAARTWLHLEHADRVANAALRALESMQDADVDSMELRDLASALGGVDKALARLEGLIQTRAKLAAAEHGISQAEFIAMLRLITAWVRELAADDTVPRDRLADQLVARIQAYVDAQQAAASARA